MSFKQPHPCNGCGVFFVEHRDEQGICIEGRVPSADGSCLFREARDACEREEDQVSPVKLKFREKERKCLD